MDVPYDSDILARQNIIKKQIYDEGLPGFVLNRMSELKSILQSVNSIIFNEKPEHLFIYGKSGTGKTSYIRYLLRALKTDTKVIPIYINCNVHSTKMAILSKIAAEMKNFFSRRGFAGYEIFEKIRTTLRKENKSIILVLDDVDALLKNECNDLLYLVLEENFSRKNSFLVIAITDYQDTFEHLDSKIKSSLMFRILDFHPYNRIEIKEILDSVSKSKLINKSCNTVVLDRIAELSESTEGNARFAKWLLRTAARRAERRQSEEIEMEDVKIAYERLSPFISNKIDPSYPGLSKEELLILDILKTGEKSSSEIYDVFLEKIPKSKRQVRNYLSSLVSKGYIESEIAEDNSSYLKPKVFRLIKG